MYLSILHRLMLPSNVPSKPRMQVRTQWCLMSRVGLATWGRNNFRQWSVMLIYGLPIISTNYNELFSFSLWIGGDSLLNEKCAGVRQPQGGSTQLAGNIAAARGKRIFARWRGWRGLKLSTCHVCLCAVFLPSRSGMRSHQTACC
jgi:hypothetical protein